MARETRYDQIIAYVKSNPGCTRNDLAAHFEAGYVYISTLVSRAVDAGALKQELGERESDKGRRPYRLTAA